MTKPGRLRCPLRAFVRAAAATVARTVALPRRLLRLTEVGFALLLRLLVALTHRFACLSALLLKLHFFTRLWPSTAVLPAAALARAGPAIIGVMAEGALLTMQTLPLKLVAAQARLP